MSTITRRSFVQAAGVATAAVAAAGTASALADSASATASEATAADYLNIYADGVVAQPARVAACPGPRGPIAFESRTIADDEITRTEDFDVVVVGAGIGGLIATLKAADMGANVLLLEKMTKGRGCFECFGAAGAKCQEGTEIDKTALFDEIQRSAYWRCRPEPAHTYCDRSGEATDFWQEMLDKGQNGFVITKVEQNPSTCGMPALTPIIDTELGFYDSPALPESAGVRSGLSGIYVCLEMQQVAKSAYENVDMRFSTPAVQLTQDESGRVTGVIAKDADGYFKATASKGVILATGGYDCNPEMMQAWTRPEDYANSSWWNPGWGTTGDGHMMGLAAGAQMDPIPQPVMNFRWGNPDSFDDARTWNAVYFGILVNGRGQRFVREDLPFQSVSNAQNAQPAYGKNCWYVFDETMADGMLDDATLEEFKGKGWLYEAASLEELGEAAGIDGAALAQVQGQGLALRSRKPGGARRGRWHRRRCARPNRSRLQRWLRGGQGRTLWPRPDGHHPLHRHPLFRPHVQQLRACHSGRPHYRRQLLGARLQRHAHPRPVCLRQRFGQLLLRQLPPSHSRHLHRSRCDVRLRGRRVRRQRHD